MAGGYNQGLFAVVGVSTNNDINTITCHPEAQRNLIVGVDDEIVSGSFTPQAAQDDMGMWREAIVRAVPLLLVKTPTMILI